MGQNSQRVYKGKKSFLNQSFGLRANQKYADDDPVWNAIPTNDECVRIWSRVIEQAVSDATLGVSFRLKINTHPIITTNRETLCARRPAVSFIRGNGLRKICLITGMDHSYISRKLNKVIEDCNEYLPEQYKVEVIDV